MERIVITGLGVVSSIGIGKRDFTHALKNGKCGVCDITSFDVSKLKSKIACLIKDFNLNSIDPQMLERMEPLEKSERSFLFALCAVLEALSDSQVNISNYDKNRIGVCLGASLTGNDFLEEYIKELEQGEPNPELLLYGLSTLQPFILKMLNINGIGVTISTACASGGNSIGVGYDLIKHGMLDLAITGGTDCLTRLVHGGFNALQALDDRCCRPFSIDRHGTVLAEGAAILILESLNAAKKRGVPIYAEVLGYSIANDAYNITAPEPTGEAAADLMEKAIKYSGIKKEDINYINTHGTGTPANDLMETLAIKKVFGEGINNLYINANKSQVGHLLAAAGSIEAAATVVQMNNGFIAPIVNVQETDIIDPELNFVVEKSINKQIEIGLSNSFGFGGNSTCLVLGRYYENE